MIKHVNLKNFGPIKDLSWNSMGKINLVIGGNGTGKTFLLKSLYSAIRTLEEFKRGNDKRKSGEIIANRLYWTFQTDKIGDLVSKGADERLSFECQYNKTRYKYNFGKDTTRQIDSSEELFSPIESDSVFIPAKEILTIQNIILKSREQDKLFGFDETYYELARALRTSSSASPDSCFDDQCALLEEMLDGRAEFEEASGTWVFKKGQQKYAIGVVAEGIKKIAMLDCLLKNHYIKSGSVVFIDEPESGLHPSAISKLIDVIVSLSRKNIQFFMASHSYFVIKKLYLVAQQQNISIPIMAYKNKEWELSDLKEGMPENSMINESILLYKEEVSKVLR